MKTFQEENLLVAEYERRLDQMVGAPEMSLTYKWLILATVEGDRELHTPGEIQISDAEEEALHEIFRKAREARRAAQQQKGAN